MPHQCVRCGTLYGDGAKEILSGCQCGARLFFYIKKEQLETAKEIHEHLSKDEKKQIEEDVFDIIGHKDAERPVILDLESIRILKPGKFEIDLVHLFNKEQPLIYKIEEGKYIIDLAETFRRRGELKEAEGS
ncbi:hypothetical protein HYS48_02580 [Candidatus Woesearchaeota archaeon]|nr:hypothetical protein [Candidatus Woesearchaeota archaeon]